MAGLVGLALLSAAAILAFGAQARDRDESAQAGATLDGAAHTPAGAGDLAAASTAPGVLSAQGFLQLPSALPAHAKAMSIPILMYHYVDDAPPVLDPDASSLTVRTKAFELQMDFLARNGYHTVTLEQVYAAMAGLASLPAKPVALTFDDGGLDDYTVAFPILRSHHFVASFFVITGFVGGSNTMSWNQLRAMRLNGMAIESHTARHADLTKVTAVELREELTQSREAIQTQLGSAPLVLSYPFGHYDQRVVDAARSAGYLMAVTTHQGRMLAPGSAYSWPRVHVGGMESMKGFEASLGVASTL
jgi:peptidoglycan/xylan/chitin deacetylase (PgdA/CDA1 family)